MYNNVHDKSYFIFLNLIQVASCVSENTINVNCNMNNTQSGDITVG